MSATRSFNLEKSKWALSALGYAARRLIDMEAAWITDFPEFHEKISIGLSIGYSSKVLEALTNRLNEQNTIEPEYISRSSKVVELFDSMAAETDLSTIQLFIASATQGILSSVRNIQRNLDPLYDQPSTWAIRDVIQNLEDKMNMLRERGCPTPHSDFPDALSIDCNATKWARETKTPVLRYDAERPFILRQSDENTLDGPVSRLLDTIDGRRRFVHFIYADIEIAAAEICARNIVEYGAVMPPQFTYDMARQTSDEARHAIMAQDMLAEFGGKLGDYTYKNNVWAAYMKGADLAEKLAIEQIIGEGNGLDTTELSIGYFKEKNLDSLLRYYEFLQADETIHCAFGNRWINFLVDNDEQAFNAVIDSALARIEGRIPGFAPVNVHARRAAEFSEDFINNRLLKREPK